MRRPSYAQVQIGATMLFALLLTTGLATWSHAIAARTCTTLEIASSQEKAQMLRHLADSYNRLNFVVDGRCARVVVDQVNSGDAEAALERGWSGANLPPRPDVWSPASQAWVVLLQRSRRGATLVPANYDFLFESPLVIGMPQPMAEVLGYPKHALGWSDIFSLAANPRGWSAAGHPEWGAFRLAKTNPTVSTSGLQALIGTYFAAQGGPESPTARSFVQRIENSVVHYGETVSAFLRNLQDADNHNDALGYVSAIALEEEELVVYDDPLAAGIQQPVPRVPLVAIYPKEGTPLANHPYVLLNWSRKADQAKDFYEFLARPAQQAVIDAHGFRDRFGHVGPLLATRPFVDASQPTLVLQTPQPPKLEAMLSQWRQVRKPARVLVLIDTAIGSAELTRESDGLRAALSQFAPQDRVGLWSFPGGSAPAEEVVSVEPVGSRLHGALQSLRTVSRQPDLAASLQAALSLMSSSYDAADINAVLVIDGSPGGGTAADDALQRQLRNQPPGHFVRVFTVGPSGSVLDALAIAGQGNFYPAVTPADFVTQVISNF